MLKRQSRHLALLLVLTMLATMFVGVGVAQAASDNSVNRILGVIDGEEYVGGTGDDYTSYNHYLTIKEDEEGEGIRDGQVFELILPSGVKWTYSTDRDDPDVFDGCYVVKVSSRVAEVTIEAGEGTSVERAVIPLNFEVDGAEGTLAVTVDPLDSTITGGDYNFARVAEGDMTASVDSVKKIGRNATSPAGTIQLRESAVGVVSGKTTVKVKLPSNFDWVKSKMDVKLTGGFSGITPDLEC
ncbi:MAG: hypothetical protein ACOX0Q_00815 [Syntrophomonadaceae bacterium]